MFSSLRETGSFRWFLYLWLGLLGTTTVVSIVNKRASASQRAMPEAAWIGLFLVLISIHVILYQWSFTHHTNQRERFIYVGFQSVLIMIISSLYAGSILGFGLFLALNVEAITVLKRAAYLVLAGFSLLVAIILPALYLGTWRGTLDYTAVILFVAGCFLLYLQQVQAHLHDRKLLHELAVAHHRLEDYARQVEELTRAGERQRLARDLHDSLAQDLTGLIMQLEAIHAHLAHQRIERAEAIAVQAKTRARAALGAARVAIDQLREHEPATSMVDRVTEALKRFSITTGIPCKADLNALTEVEALLHDPIVQIISEGLANIARHAHARRAWVKAEWKEAGLEIEVGDDGCGFDVTSITRQSGHYGIIGMQERAALLDGHLEIISHPQAGTIIRLSMPEADTDDGRNTDGRADPHCGC